MRCLVLNGAAADGEIVAKVLQDLGVDVESSAKLGSGASLSMADLAGVDCAIAVVAYGPGSTLTAGGAAVLVECGVVLGRGLPLFVLTSSRILGKHRAALAAVPTAHVSLADRESVLLHLDLFIRGVSDRSVGPPQVSVRDTKPALSHSRAEHYLDRVRTVGGHAGPDFERLVFDIVKEAGATVVEVHEASNDSGIDGALLIPGEEVRLGVVLVEVKAGERQTSESINRSQAILQDRVIQRQSGLGLLIFDGRATVTLQVTPLVLPISIQALLRHLEVGSLGEVLLDARNEAIHRL